MTCDLCRRLQDDGFRQRCEGIEHVDKCPTREVAKLSPANEGFWYLFLRILPGLMDGMGGCDYRAIGHVMDLFEVPPGQRPIMHDRCLVMISVIREMQELERKDGQQAKTRSHR